VLLPGHGGAGAAVLGDAVLCVVSGGTACRAAQLLLHPGLGRSTTAAAAMAMPRQLLSRWQQRGEASTQSTSVVDAQTQRKKRREGSGGKVAGRLHHGGSSCSRNSSGDWQAGPGWQLEHQLVQYKQQQQRQILKHAPLHLHQQWQQQRQQLDRRQWLCCMAVGLFRAAA